LSNARLIYRARAAFKQTAQQAPGDAAMKRFLFGILLLLPGFAQAQTVAQNVALPPLRGVITSVSASAMTITASDGTSKMIAFAPKFTVLEVVPAAISDVKPGTYIGTAAMKQPDGSYQAIELQIFPDSMKGLGLGTHNWNLKPKSSMTNGTVRGLTSAAGTVGAVQSNGDLTMQVDDGSGEKTVILPAGAPVVSFVPGRISDLKPGAHGLFFVSRTPDGKLVSGRANVGANGLVPPM
jgi:hypothetical protein